MKNKIINLLENNAFIDAYLTDFINDYSEEYNYPDNENKENILNFRDAIYRKWLYSSFIEGSYINVAYITYSIAQRKYKGDYSVIPHIKLNINNKDQFIPERRFVYYSSEEHPVLNDIDKLIKHANPTLIEKEDNLYLLDGGDELISELNFRSAYYVAYLIEISLRLGLIEEVKAIGCKCYTVANTYDKYCMLSSKDKLIAIIENSIEYSRENLEVILNGDKKYLLELLNNNIVCDDFYRNIDELIEENRRNYNEYENMYADDKLLNLKKHLEEYSGENMADMILMSELGVIIDLYFYNIFAYYLGLLLPSYDETNSIENIIYMLDMAPTNEVKYEMLFRNAIQHRLTGFGEKMLRELNLEIEESNDALIDPKLDDKLYYAYLERKEEQEEMEDFDEDDEIIKEVSIEIQNHMDDFYNYLLVEKKVAQSTADKHCGNMEYFLGMYISTNDLSFIKKVSMEMMHHYMTEFFIPSIAMSESGIKNMITAINQYATFLAKKKLIKVQTEKEIKDLFKKHKEDYIELFYEEEEWI